MTIINSCCLFSFSCATVLWKNGDKTWRTLIGLCCIERRPISVFGRFRFRFELQPIIITPELNLFEKVSSIKHSILHNMFVNIENLFSILPDLHTLDLITDLHYLNRTKHVYQLEHLKHLSMTAYCPKFSIIK